MANSIQIKNNFFYLDGQRWSPKGICYQPQDGVDPLTDDQFSKDIPKPMKGQMTIYE